MPTPRLSPATAVTKVSPIVAKAAVAPSYGVYAGTVTNVRDPDKLGRMRVSVPLTTGAIEGWARGATLFAGNQSGSWFIPDVGDEVLVAFEAGDVSRPYVIGSLWSAKQPPPTTMDSRGTNARKLLRTRSGCAVTIVDTSGVESIAIETPGGVRVVLKDGPGSLTLEDGNGNSVVMGSAGITVSAPAKVNLVASQVDVSASMVTVNAGMLKASGVVQCDTLMANSVISASYTPGAGNIQ